MTPILSLLFISFLFIVSFGELPPELPGEEIKQEDINWLLPNDSIPLTEKTVKKPLTWYDKAAKTWLAPPLSEQMASDRTNIPIGKGAVFIPRFSDPENEPDIEIVGPDGSILTTGKSGSSIPLEPGNYHIILGNGTHRQRITRQIEVIESKTVPVLPDWSGLRIETVDTTATSFRGEYELVRIDKFEPFGRGFGADPVLGESVKTWILKPGTYKILGRGEGYNTMVNFITVRLLPGELVNLTLVQRPEDGIILGGGNINLTTGTNLTSNWKYGANVGGTIQFNGEIDKREEHGSSISSILSFRANLWVIYNKEPYEWSSYLRLDQGFNLSERNFTDISSGADDFRISTLFIWRFLPWFGPYGRVEMNTNLLPRRIRRDNFNEFCIINKDSSINLDCFDSTSSITIGPSFSPFIVEAGAGTNLDLLSTSFIDLKFRAGTGASYSKFSNNYRSINIQSTDTAKVDESIDYNRLNNSLILTPENKTSVFEFGPQASINASIRIGRLGTAGAELKVFAPIVPEMRFTRPDYELITTLSWHLTSAITLDYDFNYQLKQPDDKDAQIEKSIHRIWLRFSYASR